MGHIPHLFLPQPWPEVEAPLPPTTSHHLSKVLRLEPGAAVTYTDGVGRIGEGHLGEDHVARGAEQVVSPPPVAITIAVAPPHDKDRLRFMIEKLAELEVRRVVFLKTRFGAGRLPDHSKATSWAMAALEQSRGAWLTEIAPGWTEVGALKPAHVLFADRGASERIGSLPAEVTIAIGPEGGWDAGEIAPGARRLGLGRTVLRIETAAIVAAERIRSARTDIP